MSDELAAVRDFNFDWVRGLPEVWTDYWDDESLNAEARQIFTEKFQRLTEGRADGTLGWIVVGQAGAGKTHLLGAFRRLAWQSNAVFILVDMTGVRDFWETLRQAMLDSLQQKVDAQFMQYQRVLATTIAKLGVKEPLAKVLKVLSTRKTESLRKDIAKVLPHFSRVYSMEAVQHQDVIRALLCWNSQDFAISSVGHSWLQGQALSEDDRQSFGFTQSHLPAQRFVKSLTWLLSKSGPTVIAFDQLDTLVKQYHVAKMSRPDSEAAVEALAIIQNVGEGLGTLRDHTFWTMPVLACLESSLPIVQDVIPVPYLARFDEEVHALRPIHSSTIGEAIVRQRLEATFKKLEFAPPYATWPFRPEAFRDAENLTPRELLKHCHALRQQWLRKGRVDEVRNFGERTSGATQPIPSDSFSGLDQRFDQLKKAADIQSLTDEKSAEVTMPAILGALFQCLDEEGRLPADRRLDGLTEFTGATTTKPLHGRLSVVDEANNDAEEVFCYRAIQHANARAFQARLRAAMTESGVDRSLPFRSLTIVRQGPMPGGALTTQLVEAFEKSGGRWVQLGDDEMRTAIALQQLHKDSPEGLEQWLAARQPASALPLLEDVLRGVKSAPPKPIAASTPPVTKQESSDHIVIGHKTDASSQPVSVPVSQLCKHTLLLAGSGSGKTVLLKRLVEEAALRGVPSLVIDCIGNLTQIGDQWRSPPKEWQDGDEESAKRFRQAAEVVVWTPGVEAERPLSLELIPDLTQSIATADELEAAVAMVKEMLSPIVAPGRSQKDEHKRGILSRALREFVQSQSSLVAFIDYLRDIPDAARLGIQNESKLAGEMADTLAAKREQDPLLRSSGQELDPSRLFKSENGRTRVSIINFKGLQALGSQQVFLGQLATTLFAWMKRQPVSTPVQGLLFVDEARNFVPSQKATPCREGFLRLAAQARNYRFGLVFATQNPKDIINTIVSQCSTHFYGKMNAPATIESVRELLREKGAAGDDVPRLGKGEFYVHNADCIPKATKVKTKMCLSRHE